MTDARPEAGGPETGTETETVIVKRRRSPLRAALNVVGAFLIVVLVLLALAVAVLNTDIGRRLVADFINDLQPASGLRIHIGRIEGSIFGRMRVRDLVVSDDHGAFFAAPVADLDYHPIEYLWNHVDIESLDVPQARLRRLPQFRPSLEPNAPLLPDIDIDLARLRIGRLAIDPAVTGMRYLVSIDGSAHIADKRAQVSLNAGTIAGPGLAGGDRLVLRLDAVPEQNRLGLGLALDAPARGFVMGLAGIDRPVALRVSGHGTWANWQGAIRSASAGQALSNLQLTAQNGTFTLRGPVAPGLFFTGPAQRLVAPLVRVDATATLDHRTADLRLHLNSAALAVGAAGVIDLGNSAFQNFRLAARLLQPGAIAPNLVGRDAQIALLLNGNFHLPTVAYQFSAATLGMGTTLIDTFHATGRATVNADRVLVPIHATAARMMGLDPMIGGLTTHVVIDGDLAIAWPRIVSNNLHIRSDKVDATMVLAFDVATGRYNAAINGRIDHYAVQGVGIFDLQTNFNLVNEGSGFGIQGRFAARSRRIDNATAADLLGGQAVISATLGMGADGTIRIDNVRVNAPSLHVTSGSGIYHPNGEIALSLAGVSARYGAVAVEITGTINEPQIRLRVASPGFGVGLRNVSATVHSTAGGYAISATGESNYGPFSADIVIAGRGGPLSIQVNRLLFAGLTFRGHLQQTAAGPFVGALTLSGQGASGTVRLSAAGRYQRVDIAANANAARIPGQVPITIQRAIVQASAILYPSSPQISGDVQVAGVRSGDFALTRARARVNYQSGRGQGQLYAEGASGVPFQIAANAAMQGTRIRAAVQGQVNGIPFHLTEPLDLQQQGSIWRLGVTTLVLPQGQVRLAGQFGNGFVLQSRLDNLDLSIVNVFSPGLGVAGRATGSLDYAQVGGDDFPRAEARLAIAGFTRTGIATRSEAIDMAFAGSLTAQGGQAAAVMRRAGAVIGRVQVRLQPLPPGNGPWMTRLNGAPLSGGIRYNGPADVLMSFANLPGNQLTGPIGVAADFSGRVQDPQFTGLIRANNLTYTNEQYGTRITNLALNGQFTMSQLQITQLSGRAGSGTIAGQGTIGLSAAAGFPIDVRLQFQNAQLARGDDLGATATGNLIIINARGRQATISGTLQLPELRYQIVRQASAEIPQLEGVRHRGQPLAPPQAQQAQGGVPSVWHLDLHLRAPRRVFISGMGLEAEWSANLDVGGTSTTPQLTGHVDLVRGTLSVTGRSFELTTGHINFTGSNPPDPTIDIAATSTIDNVDVTINATGTGTNPQIAFSSSPGLPQDEIVSRILFGSSVTQISAIQAIQLAASLNSLRGGSGGLDPLGRLRAATGISRLRILGADQTTGHGTALAAGTYISNNIYIEIITDARGYTATQLEVSLTRALSIISQFGTDNNSNNLNVRYRRQY